MRVFDSVDPLAFEGRKVHFWVLAISLITIFSVGVGTLMYPAAFLHPVTVETATARQCFFGFCTLMILAVSYLADRQIVIGQLRSKLAEEKFLVAAIRKQASANLVRSFPGMSHFQDRLAMEFRRSARSGEHLSTLVVSIKPQEEISDATAVTSIYGDAAQALLKKMRRGDALYCFAPGVYGIILTKCNIVTAVKVSDRFTKSLQETQKSAGQFNFEVRVINSPGHVATARETVQEVRACLPCKVQGELNEELLDQVLPISLAA